MDIGTVKMEADEFNALKQIMEKAGILNSRRNLLGFPWIRERVDAGRLAIHCWYFDLEDGQLLGYDRQTRSFAPLAEPCAQAAQEE